MRPQRGYCESCGREAMLLPHPMWGTPCCEACHDLDGYDDDADDA